MESLFFYSDNISPPFFLLYLWKRTVADISITASPSKRGGSREKGLSSRVMIVVNCNTIGYRVIKTTILNMSLIDLILPLNQLLSNDPPNIDPIPIQKNGNIPETKVPTTTLFVASFNMSGFA